MTGGKLVMAQVATELADIRDPVPIVDWMFRALMIGGILLIVMILWILWKRQRARRARGPSGPPPLPPGDWARQELDRLAAESDAYPDKDYTIAVSDVVRGYLERAFDLPAPERTTEEFLAEAGAHSVFTPEMRTRMSVFLERCDLVKFAGQALDPEERPRLLDDARSFVEATEARQPASGTAA